MPNLKDVMGKDLAGYQLVTGHFLQLKHELMGQFPALIRGTKDVVICVDEAVLTKVQQLLSKRDLKRGYILMLANLEQATGFNLTNEPERNAEPIFILTDAEFDRLVKEKGANAFQWAPGLIGDDMDRSEFAETLQAAMDEEE